MIDIEKFICSLLADHPVGVTVREDIHKALKDQGLEYKGGKIVPIEDKTALQESEDEEIRKDIVTYLAQSACSATLKVNAQKFNKWIAWLEKQGDINRRIQEEIEKQTKQQWKSEKQGDNVNGECNDTALEEQLKIWFEKGKCSGIDDVIFHPQKYGLEKKGEQKPVEWHKEDEQNLKACLGYIPDEFLRRWLKDVVHVKYDKPTDKVEPKFKVGDWLQYRNAKPFLVEEITQQGYVNGTSCLPFEWENEIHLWSIQDAKDGDILCTYECCEPKIVFILKGMPKKHYALSYYCYYNIMYPHFKSDSEKDCLAPNDEDVKPATKQQCDTLMKAMTDAGYTFDFDKKELKKIEPKQEWSKEDEKIYQSIMDDTVQENQLDDKQTNWLRNIKERNFARPQSTWKPSNEQLHYLSWIANIWLGDSVVEQEVSKHLNELYEDLKKLREG